MTKNLGLATFALLFMLGASGCLITPRQPARTVVVHDHRAPEHAEDGDGHHEHHHDHDHD